MATGLVRPVRNFRSGRTRVRHDSAEDVVITLDFSREPQENVKEILKNVVIQRGVPSSRKTAYLNSFVKLIKKVGYDGDLGIPIPDILMCLEAGLLNEAKQVRTASLRVLRYLLPFPDTLECFLNLHQDFLVARCLDVSLDNEIERIHAIKLIRQIIKTCPARFPKSLLYALVAIGNDGATERDRMVRVSLETLCELAITNVNLVAECSGIQTLTWNILDCHQYPRLNEALTSTIIFLLNHPKTRHFIRPQVDLERLLAPFTDSHFRYSIEDARGEERDSRFIASKLAVTTVMRSWPGLIRLCHPEGTGMQSLIGILYLPYVEIRKYILELISDLFRLTLPPWTEDFSVAFASLDPSEMKDGWKITEGFVAEEEIAFSSPRPNLIDHHLAILLSAWFSAGLREALIEVVISSDGPLFNRAVLLLGELMHMANCLLPPECLHHHECLPSLIAMASSTQLPSAKRDQAHQAVMCLTRFHKMMKRGPKPCSLFLDQLLQHAGKMSEVTSKRWHLRREKLSEYYFKKVSSEETTNQAIRDSSVNAMKPPSDWDWSVIAAVLRWPDDKLKKLDDQNHIRFIKRLCTFYKPESEQFSKVDLTDPNGRMMCIVGCHLLDYLMLSNTEECDKMMTEFLQDLAENLKEVIKLNVPVEENATFGVRRLHEKMCRFYFVFIGRLSASKKGCVRLEKSGIIQSLMEMMSPSSNILYVKLAISALNFSVDGSTRPILSKALTATADLCRVYATKMLRVLMRASTPGFSQWGIEMLVTQLYDQEKSVAMSALHILDEACDNEDHLKSLIKLRPSLLHLGEKGVLLLSRFVSSVQGFRSLNDANFISSQLEKWQKYVDIVEEMLNEALMTYEKTFSGSCRRRSIHKGPKKDVFLPAHLYGQLTMHDEGLELLKTEGHIGLSVGGLAWLETQNIIPEMIRLAEECGVFSIRGTAIFVLGLVACTRKGTDILCELGWESRCHSRKETFPVLDQDGWMHAPMEEALFLSDRLAASASQQMEGTTHQLPTSPASYGPYGPQGLSLIQEEPLYRSSASRPGSLPPGVASLRASTSSVHSAREPLMMTSQHGHVSGLGPPPTFHSIPPVRSPPGVTVQHMGRQAVSLREAFSHHGHSMPHRSKSERTLPKQAGDFRPRAQTGDKSTLPAPPEVTIAQKCESEPLNVDSIRLQMVEGRGDMSERESRRSTSSRDSIQLIASPVVKLRTSSDEDSAVHSDNCDSNHANEAVQKPGVDTSSVHISDNNNSKNGTQPVLSISGDRHTIEEEVGTCFRFPSNLSPQIGDTASGSGDGGESSEGVSFKVGSFILGSGTNKDNSSSSESSNRSKSRGSSFNTATDSTSGVGSCDSNRMPSTGSHTHKHAAMTSTSSSSSSALTPIPSSSSLSTLVASTTLLQCVSEQEAEPVHHSTVQRSLFRLTRVPSYKRRSASPAISGPGTAATHSVIANGGFTSPRDVLGYAALRNIKRQRAHSSETEADPASTAKSSTHLDPSALLRRTISQDSEVSADNNMWLSMRRNVSSISLQDQDAPSSPFSILNKAAFKPLSPSNRFVGISLPVDIRMIFEVVEGEDQRTSNSPLRSLTKENAFTAIEGELALSCNVPPLKLETSFSHNPEVCLLCTGFRQQNLPVVATNGGGQGEQREQEEQKGGEEASGPSTQAEDMGRLRGGSVADTATNTPSSNSGPGAHDTGLKKLTEDSETGRELIRMEVMRLIVNLGSSVGLKASETGLLNLKQRFPKCFRDICFYSEVCHLLSTYSYRLLARRFIHELFDDLNTELLLESSYQYLDIDTYQHMEPIRQDSLDEFHDFSFS
ncbi:rapamycin-insensitive companion of mtor [Plakobranchus ocellatus]|uniref:Rapamycin-insensitive companion of mtor n=1 Tax=Plakobranchus ocellatus TaxID=259542 RepID=A0AAV3Z0N8_9GAST|nr:rapamycin-insensitive companion of mtor [Plakobranchus ocellatus]